MVEIANMACTSRGQRRPWTKMAKDKDERESKSSSEEKKIRGKNPVFVGGVEVVGGEENVGGETVTSLFSTKRHGDPSISRLNILYTFGSGAWMV